MRNAIENVRTDGGKALFQALNRGDIIQYGDLDDICENATDTVIKDVVCMVPHVRDVALYYACRHKRADVIQCLVDIGADVNYGLLGACEAQITSIAHTMVSHGATALNRCLVIAAHNGDCGTVRMLLVCGATNATQGLSIACYENNDEMCKLCIQFGADTCFQCHWSTTSAEQHVICECSSSPLYVHVVKEGVNIDAIHQLLSRHHTFREYESVIESLCRTGQHHVILMLVNSSLDHLNCALSSACYYFTPSLVLWLLRRGAELEDALTIGCRTNNLPLITMALNHGAKLLNHGLVACVTGERECLDAITSMLESGATNTTQALSIACENTMLASCTLLVEYGASQCLTCGWDRCRRTHHH